MVKVAPSVALAFVTRPGRDFFALRMPPADVTVVALAAIGLAGLAMLVAHRIIGDPDAEAARRDQRNR